MTRDGAGEGTDMDAQDRQDWNYSVLVNWLPSSLELLRLMSRPTVLNRMQRRISAPSVPPCSSPDPLVAFITHVERTG
jgi:hypothetical protein